MYAHSLPNLGPCATCPRRHSTPSAPARNDNNQPIKLVQPTGPQPARVMLIGEYPGREENTHGFGFMGRAGDELDQVYLPRMGLGREDIYVTNAMKCQRGDGEAPEPHEARTCAQHWLPGELMRVRPEFVVIMGSVTAKAVLPESFVTGLDLETYHGRLLGDVEYTGDASSWVWGVNQPTLHGWRGHTLLTYNPAYGIRNTGMMTQLLEDFTEFRRIMWTVGQGQYPHALDPYPFPVYRELTDPAQVWESLRPEYSATRGRLIAADTETDGKSGPAWCLSYSTMPGTGYVIPADARDALAVFNHVAAADRFTIVELHNATFDEGIMGQMGISRFRWRDTMHTAYQLGNLPQGLKPLAARLCGMRMVDYDEVVRVPSLDPVKAWADTVRANITAAIPTKQPRKKLVLTKAHTDWKKHARLLGNQIDKTMTWLHTDGESRGADFPDPWKWHADPKYPNRRRVLKMFAGGAAMPPESIVHVPRDRAVQYAGRDGDATLRVRMALRPLVRELRRAVRPGGIYSVWKGDGR